MNIDELFVEHQKQIDNAKVSFSDCNHAHALVLLCDSYASNRQLIQVVYALIIEAGEKLPAGTEILP